LQDPRRLLAQHARDDLFVEGDGSVRGPILRRPQLTLEEALALLAQPKQRRGRGEAKPPLRELGPDPVSSKPVVLKEGRFGPYVTDGETNASLRRGDDPETVTIERAAELLADRRSKGPAPKKKRSGGRRSAA